MTRFLQFLLCLAIAGSGLFLSGCGADEPQWFALEGQTMGTTYHIQYYGKKNRQRAIDDLLKEINQSVSTYIPTSTISKFNETGALSIPLGDDGIASDVLHIHFFANLEEAHEVWEASDGFFDPTVGPLVEMWGFGSAGRDTTGVDSSQVLELVERVGMQHVNVEATSDTIHVRALRQGLRLDFSALAKGYAVDRIADLLLAERSVDFFIEIGGEVRAGGSSPRGDEWIAGISEPSETAEITDFAARIRLRNAAMATSGNYRNVYVRGSRKVWHTINPKTGFPEENNLLSATIVHPLCMTADALATACMAMGPDEAIGLVRSTEGARGYFIYVDMKGDIVSFVTENLSKDLLE